MDSGSARFVFVDPDGTFSDGVFGLVVAASTNVIYGHQCAGAATEERLIEGYYVPLGGVPMNTGADAGLKIDPVELLRIFHVRYNDPRGCRWGYNADDLPADRMDRLRELVAMIPVWTFHDLEQTTREALVLDESRLKPPG